MPDNSTQDNHHAPSTYELLTQLSTGPTIREVAANLLRSALREQYPTLMIDPDLAMVITPHWRIAPYLIQPAPPSAQSLTSVLARQALSPEPVIYIDGEHYLTLQPDVRPALHLPVKIDAIARLINELSPLIFVAFQEQQLDHWNASNDTTGPRWQRLSQSLRNMWNLTALEGWDEHDCAMARMLFHFPDPLRRPGFDPYRLRAYLVDIDALHDNRLTHVGLTDMAVLIGEHERRQRILTYSLADGYRKFESLERLGAALPSSVVQYRPDVTLQWRLYEPAGNFFDSTACALIALQLQAIGSLGSSDLEKPPAQTMPVQAVTRVLPVLEDLSDQSLSNMHQIHERLPDWLANASDLDVTTYSRYMTELAQLHTQSRGRSFRDGILPIRDYAREHLQNRLREHPQGAGLNVDKIQVSIESPVLWGTFILPGASDTTQHSLIDLALANLTGLPTGQASVRYNGGPAPEWLSYNYLKELIETLDIGEHYPALIKRTLLDNPAEAQDRQLLYTRHLRLQLPLLALQWKIQGRNGLDERGYRMVAAAVQAQDHDRQADGQEIVIRRLAFIPTLRPGQEQDVVANMFVIGPRDHTQGPCLLYSPLLDPVLAQYPSRQNLLYAIKHHRTLRDAVLAWLPEDIRFNYEQYVFPGKLPSPWTVVQGLVEPQVAVQMSGPIALSDEVLGNDTLATLFQAHAHALVELATRQSVSNVQKRWASYRQIGWQLFSATLPFMGRTVGIAAWIWQIMDDLQTVAHSEPSADEQPAWTAQVDLLLNLGMALLLHVALRHPDPVDTTKARPLEPGLSLVEEPESLPPVKKILVVRQPDLPTIELPAHHQGPLHISGALNRTPSSLGATLDRFKVSQPAGLGEQVKEPGPHLHLYALAHKWYANVGERWFEVKVDSNDNVIIIDPTHPSHTGPLLVSNLAGQWFVDTRLRLRGAGFRNRRQSARDKAPSRISDLREKLNKFDADEKRGQTEVSQARAAIDPVPGPSSNRQRQAFLDKVDSRLADYDVPIRQLRSLNIIDTVPNYQSSMIDYLRKQLLLTRSAIAERLPIFRDKLVGTVEDIEAMTSLDIKQRTEVAQAMADLNLDMIKRMEYTQTRYRELESLGVEGAKVIQATIRALPDFRIHDLKALQLTLSRYLCIGEGSGEAFTDTYIQLNDIINIADLNVQTWIETLTETHISNRDERIEVLNSLVEQFALVDQRLLDLHAEHPEYVLREPLETLRQQVEQFNQPAVRELALLLRERKAQVPKPGTSRTPQTPRRKVIKTRFNGVMVGEPRAAQSDLVDIKAPVTGKVIATFHEKSPGVWVERQSPSSSRREPQTRDLATSMEAGQTLLNEEPTSTLRTLEHAKKAGRIPVEIEEMLHQYAARLEHAASAIEEALTRLNLTDSDNPSAATLNRKLNDTAQRLYEQGTTTRIRMTKQQPPTAARVEWLHAKGLVKIAKVVTRRRLKGPGKNYLDEYEVRDHQTHAVLWYAHFHYESPTAAPEHFSAGHLKTRDQQKLGGAIHRTGLSDRDQIAIYRSEISPQLARSLFFQS
ncbi:hypothetical protein GIW56_10685 [Pseudomonas gessardii]|uniref:Dermonecrotic toxin N-terminal domain-containing protein n=4 Tax=Pseudomonas gessardii TaxID=78544 RepID=A0ABS9F4J4_9PSED|nr:DUF6543 domain-containing protein [Pseudomonas gessardii]MCF5093762.1 hypothetical protein [Pseudomonas gessardii]MCF5107309.1 hypothetical protein [Pseudomonas gessardii]